MKADNQQTIQLQLNLDASNRSASDVDCYPANETLQSSKPNQAIMLMERICEPQNLNDAWLRVKANKGSAGVDTVTIDQFTQHFRQHEPRLKDQLLTGTYQPSPVRGVKIPKPNGGQRQLGIPTVLDRVIQQAILQILQPAFEENFEDNSYGFRPKRSAHQAIKASQQYIQNGYNWVIDMDMEKFFDRVNHDRLMARLARDIEDKRLLRILRAYLKAGVIENGLHATSKEGVPQGGPLSPLLSNIVLDELDKELLRRGHRFVRYADDFNIYVRGERSARRVMGSVIRYIEDTLKLKVNRDKSAVGRPWERTFLGFTFNRRSKIQIAPKSLDRFKQRVREITKRGKHCSFVDVMETLKPYITGWTAYYGQSQYQKRLHALEAWTRRRLRCLIWRQWKRPKRRYRGLCTRGVPAWTARRTAASGKGPWPMSNCPDMLKAFPTEWFYKQGLPKMKCFENV